MPVQPGLRLLFLQIAGIGQDDGHQVVSGRRDIHLAAEAVLDQLGQIAAVVNVGVAEDDEVDVAGRYFSRQALLVVCLRALDRQTGIDQKAGRAVLLEQFIEEKRAGNRLGGAKNVHLEHRLAGPGHFFELTFIHVFLHVNWRPSRLKGAHPANTID
ncbi:MAG: hypothetical protein BWY75_01744 [bacterium ADurb.Bin425]|nr:MAG: hypothetical protein BWY75_01744 [bacterium ADurb.Bin425]